MYNQRPTLSIDVKYIVDIDGSGSEYRFDKEMFDAALSTAISMTANIYQIAGERKTTL